ncbi:MAG: hypothetical protein WA705_26105 [Candidatus Ozemobacteraceae bacterium]
MLFISKKWNRLASIFLMVAFMASSGIAFAGGAPVVKGSTTGSTATTAGGKALGSLTGIVTAAGAAVGTKIAIQMINGQPLSLTGISNAVRSTATVQFAGTLAGSAVGAAGGQVAAGLVRSFLPGPIGAIAGAFLPVLGATAGASMGGEMGNELRSGQFTPIQAWQKIDKVDLVGSAVGSTVGMMLGAPVPIIGPIIGGMIGGFIGSKVAKFVANGWKGNLSLNGFFSNGTNINSSIPFSSIPTSGSGQTLGMNNGGGQLTGGLTPTNDVGAAVTTTNEIPVTGTANSVTSAPAGQSAPVSGDLTAVERKYYDTYLNYNRLLEQGKSAEAQKVAGELQVVAEQYNALKAQKGTK